MAVNRFYLVPFSKDHDPVTEGFATAMEAGTAAAARFMEGRYESKTKIAVVRLVAVLELDNPTVKSTLADNM